MHARFIIATFLIAAFAYPAWSETTFDEIKREFRPSDALLLDRDGEVMQRLRTSKDMRDWPGRHVVQLLDASGKVVDEIRLEGRGADVRSLENASVAATGRLK